MFVPDFPYKIGHRLAETTAFRIITISKLAMMSAILIHQISEREIYPSGGA